MHEDVVEAAFSGEEDLLLQAAQPARVVGQQVLVRGRQEGAAVVRVRQGQALDLGGEGKGWNNVFVLNY